MQGEQEDLAPEELAPEELAQEDTAQDAEANLAREEYFREILRGYSPQARRRLRQLNTTEDPRSVLDEEWVQYFRDGLVETRRCPSRVERLGRSIAGRISGWALAAPALTRPRRLRALRLRRVAIYDTAPQAWSFTDDTPLRHHQDSCRKEPHKRHIVDPTAKPALCGIFDSNGAGLASAHV